jgi:indole-3-acetate monooxygenase
MKQLIHHPSEVIDPGLTDIIRASASEAEHLRALHDDQLRIIIEQNWLNMFVPTQYAGLERSLPEILKTEEGISWADGSTGWIVTLCSGAAWFIGFLDSALASEIFSDSGVCIAGSGAVTGTANVVEGGYEIEGYWKYASGCLHATWLTANCYVKENGVPLCNADGTPVIQSFALKKNEVILHKVWSSMGMIATGSHAFEVRSVRVPANRSFTIASQAARLNHPVFQYPFLQLAETTLAVNLSGMTVRFIDLCEQVLLGKEKGSPVAEYLKNFEKAILESREMLMDSRFSFYNEVNKSWRICQDGKYMPDNISNAVSANSHSMIKGCREIINRLYPYCGLSAADTQTEINRVWRNFHTASQHSLFLK